MALFSRDPILLTPGPLTTSLATKAAMLRDWGSWDAAFNAVTADMRRKLLDIVHGHDSHVCVPMQGSGTFSVEAAVNTLVPRDGHVLVLINGAYGKRFAKLTEMMGRRLSTHETPEDVRTTAEDVDRLLARDARFGHPRRAVHFSEQDEEAGDEEDGAEDADPSNRVRAAMKDLRHEIGTNEAPKNLPSLLRFFAPGASPIL